ncbi:hydroxycarboxylic acid receptor 2-like [Sphaeramia orbicularis]|uniref:Hydroxycarboxylic acid receptor 2-like n=1 Tax=Sphaeramia orbicularis TaxID=375764 RepID=A0A673CIV5_9TELE|nr:hydroxycarboxylic acid receptor 2-like [Sphaeramia orbicularis]XP_029977953.1 hydroxycarboxylic acid receptor 2-like [Sphaeramia orbicularis]
MLSHNVTMSLNSTRPGGVGGCPPVGIQLEGVVLPPVLTVDVVLGLLGNVVALWIFCVKLKSWNPNTLFLFNLVIADFMALVSLPLRIDALLRGHWVFGDGLCRINLFLMFSNRTASIALMTVVAVYRYFKVVHPHHRLNRLTKRQAVFVSASVWALVVAPRVPMLAYSHIKLPGNRTQCFFFTSYKEASRAIIILVSMHRILTVLEFAVPMLILLFCSVRIFSFLKQRQMGRPEKVRKAMRVCVAIVVVFVVCFLPTTVTTVGIWVIKSYRPWDCASFYTFTQLNIVSLGLNFLNSALDPVVYVFSSSMFRRALCGSLPRALRCKRDRDHHDKTASSSGSQSTTQQELKSIRADEGSEAN